MLIVRILALPDFQLYRASDASQRQGLFPPVVNFSMAQGEKLRLGG
jgi:hypothetical protein